MAGRAGLKSVGVDLLPALRYPLRDLQSLVTLAGYAGLGPMVAGLVIVAANGIGAISRAAALAILVRYAALALSFVAGIRWGVALRTAGLPGDAASLLLSLVPIMTAWVATLLAPPVALGVLAAGFAGLGAWDVWSAERGRLPGWYGALRFRLTIGATASLVLTLFALLR